MDGGGQLSRWITDDRSPEETDLFHPDTVREIYVDGTAGSLRVLHCNYRENNGGRPVVFLPGWGTSPGGFTDFFRMLHGSTECYYLESREKNSSRLPEKGSAMGMDRNARDLQEVLQTLGLSDGRDYVLMGTCWGSTIISHSLSLGLISPPTVVVFDPMPRLWFPRRLLKTLFPLLPVPFLNLIRPLGREIALLGMQEETQRKRTEDFINGADLGKWKRAALACADFDLYDSAPRITREILIFTGVNDKIHNQSNYPAFLSLLPEGRLFNLPVDESDREFLLGLIAREFGRRVPGDLRAEEAHSEERSPVETVPQKFLEFEVKGI